MKDDKPIESMQGYKKIQGCCRQARKDGFEFAVSYFIGFSEETYHMLTRDEY
jgi:hypothetical protein